MRWRPRWYETLPEVVVGLGLLWFIVDETDAATSAFSSGRALVLMALTALGWLAGRALAARFLRSGVVRTAAFTLAGVAILAVVVLPAYDDETVIETFGDAAAPSADSATDARDDADPAAPTTTTTTTAPVVVRAGTLEGIDHDATGTVEIFRTDEGRFVVGLIDFDIQPGPDYDLYVVPGPDRDDREGAIRLDDLRGNRGTQFYDVPAGTDLTDGPWTVLVWCQTFAVPIANATPA